VAANSLEVVHGRPPQPLTAPRCQSAYAPGPSSADLIRATNPSRSRRSTSRVRPLGLNTIASASSDMRFRRPGVRGGLDHHVVGAPRNPAACSSSAWSFRLTAACTRIKLAQATSGHGVGSLIVPVRRDGWMPRRVEASGDPTAHASGAREATVSGAVRQRCTNHAAGQAEPDTSSRAGHVSTSAAEGSSDGPPPALARATSAGRPLPPTTSDHRSRAARRDARSVARGAA